MMKKGFFLAATAVLLTAVSLGAQTKPAGRQPSTQQDPGQPAPAKMTPAMSEYYEPVPPVVSPGDILPGGGFSAPSDAIILFDGKDLSAWQSVKGGPAEWTVADGVMTVDKKKGDIQTKEVFGDFQLHIEWKVPEEIQGESQSRGNSGIKIAKLYEVQILDSYNNKTYVNGQAGSIYKQTPPLVNAMRRPGEWNVYDIIYTAPTFREDGSFRTKPRVTLIHNGVLVQNDTEVLGTTKYIGFPTVDPHSDAPILLQSHGDPSIPISFRNIWIRKL